MKFSVVTISYNQGEFLERAIASVLSQQWASVEYIVVDPGSTDGSLDIIEKYRSKIDKVINEPDRGPADGLNRGFALATGDVYCYLNSDDMFEPGAFSQVAKCLGAHPHLDVICGHAWVTDAADNRIRRVWSDPFNRLLVAYGAGVQIQPSTFIRRQAFRQTRGFNVGNRSNWDGELLVDLFLSGARIDVIDEFLSCYRLHETSITNSGRLDELIRLWDRRRFEKLMGRKWRSMDARLATAFRAAKHVFRPSRSLERLRYGPLYRRGANK